MSVWSWLERLKQRGVPDGVRVVGWGPFPVPGEARRHREAAAYAEQVMAARRARRQEEAGRRGETPAEEND